nr:RNA-directed DNA polymerase, eukaryota, reverse transcriptase zinc-binding domain protein [Tanacetum cinerariifolium]
LLSVLRCFYLASGLKINLHKSKLIEIGVSSNVVAAAASLIGCSILTAHFNYLGVKVGSNMSRITSWDDVISKPSLVTKGDLDTHKLVPRRSAWQDVILAIHSLQNKGEVSLKVLYKRLYALEMCKSISVAEKMGHLSLSHFFRRMPRGSQEFSVKSSRILIDNTILPKAEVPTRWLRVVPIKVTVHAWRVCLDKLPTRANLSLRGIDIPLIACPICNSAVESSSHIFFVCPLARQVWTKVLIWWELEDVAFNSYNEWLNWIVNIRLHKQLQMFLEVFIGEWNNNNIQTLLSVLRCFYLASGLKINFHKSKLMGIGVSSNVVAAAASLIGCSILTAHFNYLGVEVGSNLSRITSWDDVISKVSSRLLEACLDWLEYGSNLKKNGGLGVSSFFAHNRALDSHKLIPKISPWQDVIFAIHSLQSKGINLMDFIQKKVGNGENTSFWDDSWLGEVALKVIYKRLYALEMCKSISVAEKMGHLSLSHFFRRMPRDGVKQENYGLLCSKVADLVLPNISDRWCWYLEGSQEFSVKSSHILIDNTILPKAEDPTRWLRVVPIKINVHAWRVCLDKLPIRANLFLRGIDISLIACPLCNSAVESSFHIFLLVPWLVKFGEIF